MSASVPIHARNHRPGGVDPIGGVNVDMGRYVIAAVPAYRNLWVGGHGPMSSGPDGKTTIACPLIETAGPAPVSHKFYDHSFPPEVWTSSSPYAFYLGCAFLVDTPGTQITGVQFWGPSAVATTVKLWRDSDSEELLVASGAAGIGWNEIYFSTHPVLDTGVVYVVGFSPVGDRPTAPPTPSDDLPMTAGALAHSSGAGVPWRRRLTAGATDKPDLGSNIDYGVGPIFDHVPDAGDPRIVATASHGTDDGVFIHRTEKGDNVIDIFWSASEAIVAANVFVMGIDPGDTQPCESENYHLLGNCLPA